MSTLSQTPPSDEMEFSVSVAGPNKFAAKVIHGATVHKLGKFDNEAAAWVACKRKSIEIRRHLAGGSR